MHLLSVYMVKHYTGYICLAYIFRGSKLVKACPDNNNSTFMVHMRWALISVYPVIRRSEMQIRCVAKPRMLMNKFQNRNGPSVVEIEITYFNPVFVLIKYGVGQKF